MTKQTHPRITPGTQTASFWIDESGASSSGGRCFVMAAVKTRHADDLQREVQALRQAHDDYKGEFKFTKIQDSNFDYYKELVAILEASDARLAITVVDGGVYNPFRHMDTWEAHAMVAARLVAANMNRNEVATVLMDGISTPAGCSLGRRVKALVNKQLSGTVVTTAVSLDSKCNDLLQVADMVAGSIRTLRRPAAKKDGAKMKLARRLAAAFDIEDVQEDFRSGRVRLATLRPPRRQGRLQVVNSRLTGS